ncbi:MAG: nitroreductase family protein [Candidatus Diapherotrites archaeon]|nr:nitroreductase family protein [Candidatus Diapherotrites archaeon]
MDFFRVLSERHSVRAYRDKPIAEQTLGKLLLAINSAPSAGNRQAYEIVVVKGAEKKKKIADVAHQQFIANAPVVLVFVSSPERNASYGARGKELYAIQDAAIAASYAQLAATALGLCTCWIGAFDEGKIAEIIRAEKNMKVACIMPVAYAKEIPFATERRSMKDIVHEDSI